MEKVNYTGLTDPFSVFAVQAWVLVAIVPISFPRSTRAARSRLSLAPSRMYYFGEAKQGTHSLSTFLD